MLWYSNASFIFDFIVFVPVKDSMLIWKNLTIYWWLAHRTFILQGCDASKCCPPSFAKNGNGQLPFNRWRLLVVTFNCLTFAHLLQLSEQHFQSGRVTTAVKWAPLIFVGALLLYRSTAPCLVYRSEPWRMAPIFRKSFYDPTFLQEQRRSAPDLALLPASVELQVESSSSARPSILKVGIAFNRFPIPSRCVQTFVLNFHCFP